MLKACMACDIKGGVARNGTLPWPKNKADLKNFKDYTDGKIVIMGQNTWYDPIMPKPLPNRYNIVVQTNPNKVCEYGTPNLIISGTPDEIIQKLSNPDKEIVVIGGANLLQQFIDCDLITDFQLTIFEKDYKCDTFINLTELFYKFDVLYKEYQDDFCKVTLRR